jgi:hypothetical protein
LSPHKKQPGLPPLFGKRNHSKQQQHLQYKQEQQHQSKQEQQAVAASGAADNASVVSGLTLISSSNGGTPTPITSSSSSDKNKPEIVVALPVLSGDEVERDRRVDLRIFRSSRERRQSMDSRRADDDDDNDCNLLHPQQRTIGSTGSVPTQLEKTLGGSSSQHKISAGG